MNRATPPCAVSLAELFLGGFITDGDIGPDGRIAAERRTEAEREYLRTHPQRVASSLAPPPRPVQQHLPWRPHWPQTMRRKRPPPPAARTISQPVSPGPTSAECIVCMHRPRTHAVRPCFHWCVCQTCAQRMGNTCPVCRGEVQGLQRIYLV